jgi:hypothetical protein
MDKVLRQDDMVYKNTLLGMRFLDNLTDDEKEQFKNALHLVPTWATAHQINVDYLKKALNNSSPDLSHC